MKNLFYPLANENANFVFESRYLYISFTTLKIETRQTRRGDTTPRWYAFPGNRFDVKIFRKITLERAVGRWAADKNSDEKRTNARKKKFKYLLSEWRMIHIEVAGNCELSRDKDSFFIPLIILFAIKIWKIFLLFSVLLLSAFSFCIFP